MSETKSKPDWTSIAIQPAVVKVVSRLLENYERCRKNSSPIEFLEKVFSADKPTDSISNPLESGYDYVPGRPKLYAFGQMPPVLDESDEEGFVNKIVPKPISDNIYNKCDYPDVCKALGSIHPELKLSRRKDGKSSMSVPYDDASSLDSSDNRTYNMNCHCASDEEGSSSGIFTTSSTESSYSDQTMDDREKSGSDVFDYFNTDHEDKMLRDKNDHRDKKVNQNRIQEKGNVSREQQFTSDNLPMENGGGSGAFRNPDLPFGNKKNNDEQLNVKKPSDFCAKFGRREPKTCEFKQVAEDISSPMKGIRVDDDYKQAIANLFLEIHDHNEFIKVVLSEFAKTNNHNVPSGFFRVLVYHVFFNLTPRTIEGIKKIIIHSYPGKLLTFLQFLSSDQFQQTIKHLLKFYDQEFVKNHAEIHVKGCVLKKLQDEVEEFINKQNKMALRKEELENRRNKSLRKSHLHPSENKITGEQNQMEFKKDFRARPIPQTTYEAPKNVFLKKEKNEGPKVKLQGKKQKEVEVRKKSEKQDKLPEESKKETAIEPFCYGCMEKETHQNRRQESQKPETKPFAIDKNNMFPRPEPRTTTALQATTTTTTTGRSRGRLEVMTRPSGAREEIKDVDTRQRQSQATPGRSMLIAEEGTTCQDEVCMDRRYVKAPPNFKKVSIPVKQTAASVLREGARLKQDEMKTMEKLEGLAAGGANWAALEELQQRAREEAAQEELEALERKHLQGLLTREEALLARQQLLERQRERADELRREKEILEIQLEEFRIAEEEKIKFLVDKIHISELAAKEKCKEVMKIKYEEAQRFAKEKKEQLAEMQRQRQEELDQRIALIREVRALQGLTKLKKREIDFTESAGYGLLYEMSIAELHERLHLLREEIREEIEQKRLRAQQLRAQQKEYIQQTQEYIKQQRLNKLNEINSKPPCAPPTRRTESEEIQMLRQKLYEARKQRLGQK